MSELTDARKKAKLEKQMLNFERKVVALERAKLKERDDE